MGARLRRVLRSRDESGQAMPLAAVGVFVMVLGVLATLNLGQAVHQKIKLQNTADSAAYTLAAMEARTFNYIAFLNRAQIAHYNTAMVMQSYMTWVGFQIALHGTATDMLTSMTDAAKKGMQSTTGCPPYGTQCLWAALYGSLTVFNMVNTTFRKVAVQLYETLETYGHQIVEAMALFNRDAVWQTQFARAALLNVHILTGMQNYVEKLDKDISFTSGKSVFLNVLVNMALNSIEYYQTFDNASGLNPFVYGIAQDYKRVFPAWKGDYHKRPPDEAGAQNDKPGTADAYRVMAELCHATRTPRGVSDRSTQSPFILFVGLGSINVMGQKRGQTKMTKDHELDGATVPAIREEGRYPVAEALSSDDFLQSATGTGWAFSGAAYVSANTMGNWKSKLGDAITAYQDDTKHYLYTGGSSGGTGVMVTPYPPATSPDFEEKSGSSSHRTWPGFAPYFKFKPSSDRTRDFNQPSTWIFLNKHHKDFQSDQGSLGNLGGSTRAPWFTKLEWRNGDQVVKLDSTIGGSRNSYLFEGINVLSRGMAYYHRPGNWREHPNFFNPFWRARLAPVGQKLQSFWDRYVSQNITTSSENAAVKGMVSFLRNAQMDIMTSFITGLVTH